MGGGVCGGAEATTAFASPRSENITVNGPLIPEIESVRAGTVLRPCFYVGRLIDLLLLWLSSLS